MPKISKTALARDQVGCATCGARPGWKCQSRNKVNMKGVHKSRVEALERLEQQLKGLKR